MPSPTTPASATYINSPNGYSSFDTSGLNNSAISQSNQQGANQIAQAKAQAAGMGGGRSSAVNNSVGQVQAGMGQNAQNIINQNALTSYQQQLGQQQAQNSFNLGQQGLGNQLYGLENSGDLQRAQAGQSITGTAQSLAPYASALMMALMAA
jgi:hypothetical protein